MGFSLTSAGARPMGGQSLMEEGTYHRGSWDGDRERGTASEGEGETETDAVGRGISSPRAGQSPRGPQAEEEAVPSEGMRERNTRRKQ